MSLSTILSQSFDNITDLRNIERCLSEIRYQISPREGDEDHDKSAEQTADNLIDALSINQSTQYILISNIKSHLKAIQDALGDSYSNKISGESLIGTGAQTSNFSARSDQK